MARGARRQPGARLLQYRVLPPERAATMQKFKTIAIVGVGLLGGSVGLAARRRRLAREVIGIGRRSSTLAKAKSCGAINRGTTSLVRGVADADLIVVATPLDLVADSIAEAAEAARPGALITDVGSTKSDILNALKGRIPRGVHFIGSHPLAGGTLGGPEHARADLFEGRPIVVTPTRTTNAEQKRRLCEFWRALGGRVLEMTARRHDEAVATTSHLTHLVASALAAATGENDLPLASTGWLDTTRVAGGNIDMWQAIIATNRTAIAKSLARYEKTIGTLRRAVERGDQGRVGRILSEAKRKRDVVGS